MNNLLWIFSHIPVRIIIIILSIFDYSLLVHLEKKGVLIPFYASHRILLITIIVVTLASSIYLAIIGGKAGQKYVEMGRSRHWHYRSTDLTKKDNTFRNILYWACKFAALPLMFILLVVAMCGGIYAFNIL